jgi:hypothetical protein
MNFPTAMRRILVGIIVKPWRLLWLVIVAAAANWLDDRTSLYGLVGIILRLLIGIAAIVLSLPALTPALKEGERKAEARRRGPTDTAR